MPFAAPFMPHELDAHPDGSRIVATIQEATGEAEQDREKLEEQVRKEVEDEWRDRVGELEDENATLQDRVSELESAERDLEDARDVLRDLATALLEKDGAAFARAIGTMADYLMDTNVISGEEAKRLASSVTLRVKQSA